MRAVEGAAIREFTHHQYGSSQESQFVIFSNKLNLLKELNNNNPTRKASLSETLTLVYYCSLKTLNNLGSKSAWIKTQVGCVI
jgi:hypothetical protein